MEENASSNVFGEGKSTFMTNAHTILEYDDFTGGNITAFPVHFLLFSTLKVMASPHKLLVHIRHASVQDALPSGKGREAG